jgi:hypothetical protein
MSKLSLAPRERVGVRELATIEQRLPVDVRFSASWRVTADRGALTAAPLPEGEGMRQVSFSQGGGMNAGRAGELLLP